MKLNSLRSICDDDQVTENKGNLVETLGRSESYMHIGVILI